MTKKQVEEIIAKVAPQDGERIRKGLEHSRTLYDLNGNHVPHDFEKENLRDVISKRDMYVIDTNSTWHEECKKHLDKAFIITPALARETTNLLNLILDRTRSKLGNIFSFGIDDRINCIIIERIDEAFQYEFDIPKLRQASRGKGPFFEKQKAKHTAYNIEEKERATFNIELDLLFDVNSGQPRVSKKFWDTGKACDLPPPEELKYATDSLKNNIRQRVPACRFNVKNTINLVTICHRTLLLEDLRIRAEFDDPEKVNVFGDMHILQAAIYLGANILSNDKRLKTMASYTGMNCWPVPRCPANITP
jgi:hypothetical protein